MHVLRAIRPQIRPRIDDGAQELAEKISVGGVELDAREASGVGSDGGVAKLIDGACDVGGGARAGCLATGDGARGRAPGLLPGQERRRAHSPVKELDDSERTLSLDCGREPLQTWQQTIVIDADRAWEPLPVRETCAAHVSTTAKPPLALISSQRSSTSETVPSSPLC